MNKASRLIFGDHRNPQVELTEVFGSVEKAVEWAKTEVDPAADNQVEAIRKLRSARPDLGLKTAVHLAGLLFD